MSDIVGGSVSLGEGDNQVVLMFSGRLKPDRWALFVEAIVDTANRFRVSVRPFGQDLTVQHRTVRVTPRKRAKKRAAKK
jgi:hypothetical protein